MNEIPSDRRGVVERAAWLVCTSAIALTLAYLLHVSLWHGDLACSRSWLLENDSTTDARGRLLCISPSRLMSAPWTVTSAGALVLLELASVTGVLGFGRMLLEPYDTPITTFALSTGALAVWLHLGLNVRAAVVVSATGKGPTSAHVRRDPGAPPDAAGG